MSTWSRTSTSSSTSDEPTAAGTPEPAPAAHPVTASPSGPRASVEVARVVHPFPSILDGVVVALVAFVAGGSPGSVVALGVSMTLLQFAIGALNDVVDAPRDAGLKPGKPIPAGLLPIGWARALVAGCAIAGVALALIAGGPVLAVLAVVVLGIGFAYDLRAKGTTLSWLPFAVGIPLLPVYGWFGASGELPGLFLVLVPAAANAGTALAVANAIVDMERDEEAGAHSIALALGPQRAGWLVVVLHVVVAVLALATAVVLGAPAGWVIAILLAAAAPLGGAALGLVAAQRPGASWRELAWEIQAVGTGLLAVAWLGALSASAGTPFGG